MWTTWFLCCAQAPAAAPSAAEAVAAGVAFLLEAQEGAGGAEWPYEGVYRVEGQIPLGYRIGGTALAAQALMAAPDFAADAARGAAVERALRFVLTALGDPLLAPEYAGGYDVRGWGHAYGLAFLLEARRRQAVPAELAAAVDGSIRFCIGALEATEIPQVGGWAYARGALREPCATSPFMTGPCLQALFAARADGFAVRAEVIERALAALERARLEGGAVAYAHLPGGRAGRDQVPGAVGRMVVTEATLHLGGRGELARVRGAIDAFFVHWDWLDQRRAKSGTHEPPYGVAPYYFYYAHYYVAQAVELLPESERAEYRRRLAQLLWRNRQEDGTWNDRVFARSANFGTAMSLRALLAPETPPPARWETTQ